MNVAFAAGGTGGHINPALAIADKLKEVFPDTKILFIGSPDGLESKLVKKAGYDFAPVKMAGIQRKLTPHNIKLNFQAVHYYLNAGKRIRKIFDGFSPDLVIGTGGYVSGPIVLEAEKMGIPTAIHEQNAYPGVTTRILSKKADIVMLTMEEAAEYFDKSVKYIKTGLPVRKGFDPSRISRAEAKKELGLDENSICIFSWGGSLGAGAINSSALALIKWEKESGLNISHIHSYGKMGHGTFVQSLKEMGIDPETDPKLMVKEYIHNMDVCTAAADLIICRSGASAISELEAMGRASILIPSPVVAGNHQYHNAMVLGKAGAAIVIEQKDLTDELIINEAKKLCSDPARLDDLARKAHEQCITDTPDRIYKAITDVMKK